MSEIGLRIRELRKGKGLTQNELAEGVVTRSYLSQIEKGAVIPSSETLEKLALRLDCKVDEFYKTPSTNHQQLTDTKKNIYFIESHLELGEIAEAKERTKRVSIDIPGLSKLDLGVYYWEKAVIYEDEGQFEQAYHEYMRSLEHLEEAGNSEKLVRTLNFLGHFHVKREDYSSGFSILNRAFREVLYHYVSGTQKVLNLYYLGFGHTKIGEFFSAALFLEEAKNYNEKTGLFFKAGDISLLLGVCYKEVSEWQKALDENFRAISFYELQGDQNQIATVYYNIGSSYYEMKEFQQAKEYFEQARQIFAKHRHKKGQYLSEIGLLKALCSYESLAVCADFAGSLQAQYHDAENLLIINKIMGDMYYERKRYEDSYSTYKRAINYIDPTRGTLEAIETIKKLVSVCFKLNDNEEAEQYYELLTRLETHTLKPVYLY